MRCSVIALAALTLSLALACAPATPAWEDPTVPVDRNGEGWWKQRFEAKRDVKSYRVAFLGDSITQGWEDAGRAAWDQHFAPLNSANFGYSGDRTSHALWRMAQGEVVGGKPTVAVVMIGTNNIGHRVNTPAETVKGIRSVLDAIRKASPGTKILLVAVLPRDPKPDGEFRKGVVEINAALAKFNDRNVTYRDYGDAFLSADGSLRMDLMPDALHLNEAGYKVWAERLIRDVRALLPRQ